MIESPPGKHEQQGSNKMKKIKMYYNDSLDVYVYIFVNRSATIKVWSDIVCTYVQQDGRDIAAMALKGMRREKMNIVRDSLVPLLED
jgi:quinolinate synthase